MQEFCKQNFEYHPNRHIIFLIKLNFYAKFYTAIRVNNLNPKKRNWHLKITQMISLICIAVLNKCIITNKVFFFLSLAAHYLLHAE